MFPRCSIVLTAVIPRSSTATSAWTEKKRKKQNHMALHRSPAFHSQLCNRAALSRPSLVLSYSLQRKQRLHITVRNQSRSTALLNLTPRPSPTTLLQSYTSQCHPPSTATCHPFAASSATSTQQSHLLCTPPFHKFQFPSLATFSPTTCTDQPPRLGQRILSKLRRALLRRSCNCVL